MDKEYLDDIKVRLREKKITYADLAGWAGCSQSWISACMNGHYPYRYAAESGRAIFPAYLTDTLRRFGVIENES